MKKELVSVTLAVAVLSADLLKCAPIIWAIEAQQSVDEGVSNANILRTPKYEGGKVSFPDAYYEEDLMGYDIKTGVPTTYTRNNKSQHSKNGTISSKKSISGEEFTELLKSIELDVTEKDARLEIKVLKEKDSGQETEHLISDTIVNGVKGTEHDINNKEEKVNITFEGTKDLKTTTGNPINLTKGIKAKKDGDESLEVFAAIKNIKGEEVEEVNYNEPGEYKIEYFTKEYREAKSEPFNLIIQEPKELQKENSKTNLTNFSKEEEPQEINSIDISNGLENSVVTSSRGYILGFKVEGTSTSPITFKYTLNGENITSTGPVLNFYDKYTVNEVQDILRSLKVESDSDVSLKVTLGNLKDTMAYNEEEGHYYQLNNQALSYTDSKIFANKESYLDSFGYLATINNEEINNLLLALTPNKRTWIGIDGRNTIWANGESMDYMNYNSNTDKDSTNPKYLDLDNGKWKGDNNKDYKYFSIIEYGEPSKRLPRPTANTESTIDIIGEVEEKEVNNIDISNGLENSVVTSSRGYILGFKVEGTSTSPITFKYTLNEENITSTGSVLNFYDKYTVNEVQDILRSLKVESDSDVSLKVTLGNLKDTMVYNEEEGHYYGLLKNNTKVSIESFSSIIAKEPALYGAKPYLANVLSNETKKAIEPLLEDTNYHWVKYVGNKKKVNNTNTSSNMIGLFNEMPQSDFTADYDYNADDVFLGIYSSKNENTVGFQDIPSKLAHSDVALIEYGQPNEKLPMPTINTTSSLELNTDDIVIDNPTLTLGEFKLEGAKKNIVTFPHAEVSYSGVMNLALNITTDDEFKITYTKNNEDIVSTNKRLVIKDLTLSEMKAVIKSLKIETKGSIDITCKLSDTSSITIDKPLYPGTTGNAPENLVDNNPNGYYADNKSNTGTPITIQLSFTNPRKLTNVGLRYNSGKSGNRTIVIKGKNSNIEGDTFKEIGRKTHSVNNNNIVVATANVTEGFYTDIQIVCTGMANPVLRDIQLNDQTSTLYPNVENVINVTVDTTKPVISTDGDLLINKGSETVDLMSGITVSDETDNLTTEDITTVIKDSAGNIVDNINTSEQSIYSVTYTASDTSSNTTTLERKVIIVEEEEFNSIDISNGLDKSVVKSSREFILGFKVEGSSDDPLKYTYTIDGNTIESTNRILNFYDKYTPEQVQEILRSLKVESNSDVSLKVTLGNLKPSMIWSEEEGHYYERITDGNRNWIDSNTDAQKREFIGYKGYLATIPSKRVNDLVQSLMVDIDVTWIGLYDKDNNNKWVWQNGEPVVYTNFNTNNPDTSTNNYAHIMKNGTWTKNIQNLTQNYKCNYIAEYGNPKERLPRPTIKAESTLEIECNEEWIENPIMELGEYVLEGEKKNIVKFPNADISFSGEMDLIIDTITEGSSTFRYTEGGEEKEVIGETLKIVDLTAEEAKSIVESLRIECDKSLSVRTRLSDISYIRIDKPPYTGAHSNNPLNIINKTDLVYYANNGNSTTTPITIDIGFKGKRKISKVGLQYNSSKPSQRSIVVKGKNRDEQNQNYTELGRTNHTINNNNKIDIVANTQEAFYTDLQIVTTGMANPVYHEVLLNGEDSTLYPNTENNISIEIDTIKPLLSVGSNIQLDVGQELPNLLEGVEVSDETDTLTIDDVVISIENSNGDIIETIDTSIEGEYTVKYSVSDSSNNITEVSKKVTVEALEVNRVDISNGFENAVVESNKPTIRGFKVETIGSTDKTETVYKYTVKGKTIYNNSKVLNFYDEYTVEELQEALRTFEVVSGEDVEVRVTIGNISPTMVYNEGEGHYYELVKGTISYDKAKSDATKRTFKDVNGYIASINNESINTEVFSLMDNNSIVSAWIGNEQGGNNTRVWVSGEEMVYQVNHSADVLKSKYPVAMYKGSDCSVREDWHAPTQPYNCNGYIVEYGEPNERLQRPTVTTSSSFNYTPNEVEEVNSVDITNGLKEATVTSNRDKIIGFKVEGVSKGDIEYTYTLNGKEVKNTEKTLNFYEVYTPQEVQDILRSIMIESLEDVELKVTLGNLKPTMLWDEAEGHYYGLNDKIETFESIKQSVSSNVFMGVEGYLATIPNATLNTKIRELVEANNINSSPWIGLGGSSPKSWLNGESLNYKNYFDNTQETVNEGKIIGTGGKWYVGGISTQRLAIVEYGQPTERLPKPTLNAESTTTVKAEECLYLGEPVISNGKITFPNAKGNIKDRANLQINLFEGYVGNEINYTLNGTKRSHSIPEIELKGITKEQLDEVLSTISFKIDYGQDIGIQVALTDNNNNVIYEGISSTEDTGLNTIDGDLSTSWNKEAKEGIVSFTFDSPKTINSIDILHKSTQKSDNNTYEVEGLVSGKWIKIGTNNASYLELIDEKMINRVNVSNGVYEGIRLSITNSEEDVHIYDIKFNGEPKKNVLSKDIKSASLEPDTQAPIITTSHDNITVNQGGNIPNITATASDNNYLEPNLTSKIVKTIISPSGDTVEVIDNMVVGEWIVKFEVEDRFGNHSEKQVSVTITPDAVKPTFSGIRGGIIKQGEPYSLTTQVRASDNLDGDLTSKIIISYTDPNGENKQSIDESVNGIWKVKYSVTDSANNTSEQEISVTVETDAIIELGEPCVNKSENTITFPNNNVSLVKDDSKQFRMRFLKGNNSEVTYTVGGTTYKNTGSFTTNSYTEAELKELLDTLTINYKGTVELETGIVNNAYIPIGSAPSHKNIIDGNTNSYASKTQTITFTEPIHIDTIKEFRNETNSAPSVYAISNNKEIPLKHVSGTSAGVWHFFSNRNSILTSRLKFVCGSNSSVYEVLIENFGTRNSYNKVFLDLTPPNLTTNHTDMEVWQGIPIPNIIGSATDDIDGNLNGSIVKTITNPSGEVVDVIDNMTTGEWLVKFEVTDRAGNTSTKEVKVTVKEDSEAPVITTNYEELSVEKGKTVPTITASATDNSGQLSGNVVRTIIDPNGDTQNAISNMVEGEWLVRYEVSDKAGNSSAKEIIVTVTPDITPPTIGISPNKDITVQQSLSVQNISATATDIVDGNVTNNITKTILDPDGNIVDSIDTMVTGDWVVQFQVADKAGNESIAKRIVHVVKNANSPVVKGAYNRKVEYGVPYDINNIFSISDDNGLKSTIIEAKSPSGEFVEQIDTRVPGIWEVHVTVTDNSDNITNKIITVTVLEQPSLDLGKQLKNADTLTFPNATINIPKDLSKRVRFNFKENPSAVVSYSINGKVFKQNGANFVTEAITKDTQEEFLSTLKITANSAVKFEVGLDGETWTPTGVLSGTHEGAYKDNNEVEAVTSSGNGLSGSIKYKQPMFLSKYGFDSTNNSATPSYIKLYKEGREVFKGNIRGGLTDIPIEFDEVRYLVNISYTTGSKRANNFRIGNKYVLDTVKEYSEDMTAPHIKGARDGIVKQGIPFDLKRNVTVEDPEEGDLTNKLQIICIAPDGSEHNTIDDSVFGDWTIKYSASDSNNNKREQIVRVTVEPSDTLQLGDKYITEDGYISFKNNKVSLQDNVSHELRFNFSAADNSELKYTVNGKEETYSIVPGKTITLPAYSKEELKEALDSLKIKYTGHIAFELGVTNDPYMPIGTSSNKKELVDGVNNTQNNLSGGVEINLPGDTYIQKIDLGANYSNIKVEALKNESVVATFTENNASRYINTDGVIADKLKITGSGGNTSEIKISNFGTKDAYQQIDLKASLQLETEKNDNIISGSYSGVGTFKRYELHRKDSISNEYIKVKEVSAGNFTDNSLRDTVAPTMDYYLQMNKEGNSEVKISSEDIDVDYSYQIKAYNGDVLSGISNESVQTIYSSGVKGYSHIIDNNTETIVESSEITNTDGQFNINNVTEDTYLHVKAIDNEGNESETLHIKLFDESHNNAPIIKTNLNKVIEFGTKFDPMDGVSGYDYEDGNITDKIKVYGAENVDVNKVGSYKVIYKLADSKGKTTEETVTIHITGNMELNVLDGNDQLNISWGKVEGASRYRMYRTEEDGYGYSLFKEFKKGDLHLIDDTAMDIKAPIIEKIYEQDSVATRLKTTTNSILSSEDTKLVIRSRDLASTYRYYIEAIDESGNVINSTNPEAGQSKVGMKGYSYSIDENPTTEAPTQMNALEVETISNAIKGKKGKILHVRSIDKNGNLGDTVHYLIGSRYITNHRPVIYGVEHKKVLLGDTSFSLAKGITAFDTEDGDLTSKIKITSDLDINKEGKYKVEYSVQDSDGNERIVNSSVTIIKNNTLQAKADKEINRIVLDWSTSATHDRDVYYEVRKKNIFGEYNIIAETEDTSIIDEMSADVSGPKYQGNSKNTTEDSLSVEIKAVDTGYTGQYQVFTRLKEDGTIIGTMNDLNTGKENSVKGNNIGGIKGYSWHLSNYREDDVDATIDQESNIINFNPEDYEWLHVAPIDIYGHMSDTIHIQLKRGEGVVTNTPPTIEASDKTIILGEKFDPMKDVKAIDAEDGDISKRVKVEGEVNHYAEGDYPLVYSVIDNDGNRVSKQIMVTVEREVLTEEEATGQFKHKLFVRDWGNPDYIEQGKTYNPLRKLEVESTKDGIITSKVKWHTDLDTNNLGEYIINYNVKDSVGNEAYFQRIVHVVKEGEIPPSIDGDDSGTTPNVPYYSLYDMIECFVGDKIDPLKNVKAYDKEDGDLTDKIQMTGKVNTLKPGYYTVTFKVKDSDGYISYATRGILVKIKDDNNGEGTLPPVIGPGDGNDNGDNNGGIPEPPKPPVQPPIKPEEDSNAGSGNSGGNNNNGDIYDELEPDIDTDGDGIPDINIDTDGDGKPDINIDTDGDGKPDINIDTDGDGIPDINVDIDGDGIPDINIDTDGDGIPDRNTDIPKTNDGIFVPVISSLVAGALLLLNKNKKRKK